MAQSRQRAMEGSVSPADIVSTPLTSKGWDYEERGFRQWEGKKITSKLAAHLNLDNPKTVVLHVRRAGSDASLIISIVRPVLPFLAQI